MSDMNGHVKNKIIVILLVFALLVSTVVGIIVTSGYRNQLTGDNSNLFALSYEKGQKENQIIVLLSIKQEVTLCRYSLSVNYDSEALSLVDYDSDLSVYSPVVNPEKDDNGFIVPNGEAGNINLEWASATNVTKEAEIIEMTFEILPTSLERTSVDLTVKSVEKMSGDELVSAEYSVENAEIDLKWNVGS